MIHQPTLPCVLCGYKKIIHSTHGASNSRECICVSPSVRLLPHLFCHVHFSPGVQDGLGNGRHMTRLQTNYTKTKHVTVM